jgi:hypothetical protein
MAGEQKGKTYEAIVKVALDRLKDSKQIKGNIYWNEKPTGMTIEPDFTIGADKDSPKYVLLVTHSSSAKNSDMKFWRNIGELAEAKLLLTTVPAVISITFDSVIKEDLKRIQNMSFDSQLVVGDLKYGVSIKNWVDINHASLATKAEDKVSEIKELLKKSRKLKALVEMLANDLLTGLARTRPELDELWMMDRQRVCGTSRVAKETFVRRGLSKLQIFDNIDLALRLYRGKPVGLKEIPQYAYELGLAKKSIGRAVWGDKEVKNAVDLLKDDDIRSISSQDKSELHISLLNSLRVLSFIDVAHAYIVRNYEKLCNEDAMLLMLLEVQKNPSLVLKISESITMNWLFQLVFDIQRAASGFKQEVGYSQFIQFALDNKKEINLWLEKKGLPQFKPRGNSAIVRGMTDWVNRRNTTHAASFSESYQALVAWVLSHALRSIQKSKIPAASELREFTVNNLLEQKLVTYRGFDPIQHLVEKGSTKFKMIRIKTCFGEASGIPGLGATMEVGLSNGVFLNWQSASDAGRDHKKKELCGRAIGLRYSWDKSTLRFIKRPNLRKLVLILDGTWRQSDLDALIRSGWDEIYYPNEIDRLTDAATY